MSNDEFYTDTDAIDDEILPGFHEVEEDDDLLTDEFGDEIIPKKKVSADDELLDDLDDDIIIPDEIEDEDF
jgi:hypothetical protein